MLFAKREPALNLIESFLLFAKMHTIFWVHNRSDIARFPWARGSDWALGNGRDKWERLLGSTVSAYDTMMKKIENGTFGIRLLAGRLYSLVDELRL